jgi:hypothetical protein
MNDTKNPKLHSCKITNRLNLGKGRAMAQAVSCRLPTAEARVRSWVSPCGICGGQSGTGTRFSPSTSVFPCQFHSTGAPLLGKGQKIIIIIVIFITGLQKKPQGCGASVASAAGPLTTKKNLGNDCNRSVQNRPSSRLLFKRVDITIYKPIYFLFFSCVWNLVSHTVGKT